MSMDGGDDGSDIFWPGYVDAVTNLVLNLLFMLTIMIVAVFMFALELNRNKDLVAPTEETNPAQEMVAEDDSNTTLQERLDEIVEENDIEVSELKLQIEMLKQEIVPVDETEVIELRKQVEALKIQVASEKGRQNSPTVVIAKTPLPKPEKNLEDTIQDGDVVVDFQLESVTLSDEEAEKLRKALSTLADSESVSIEVFTPTGFSEAKRLGFYRAIAVRNQLIEMKVAKDKIKVLVHEGKSNADNTKVLVSRK